MGRGVREEEEGSRVTPVSLVCSIEWMVGRRVERETDFEFEMLLSNLLSVCYR